MTAEAIAASSQTGHTGILAALRSASVKTGSDFEYLLGTAMRESGLDAQAKSRASSATGLFQFIEQTWLGLVKRYGERHGLSDYAHAITETHSGRYEVARGDTKAAILALRKNPELSALMAGEAANETRQSLECALGREVCEGELYAAHFLGTNAARHLIRLNEQNPNCLAADEFPQAARANHSVFYHADGTAKTVREIYDWAADFPDASAGMTPPATAANAEVRGVYAPARFESSGGTKEAASPSRMTSNSVDLRIPYAIRQSMTAKSLGAAETVRLPQAALALSPGVIEIFAALNPAKLMSAKRES